ncbi:MAG: N-acetylmuramoyl-L-alanine amidase [Candidatus Omnitrophica bacterium]|nr:N-acetylmuramoyl-L-alanine amidase [Candidatus Omnitrophota bacterium]
MRIKSFIYFISFIFIFFIMLSGCAAVSKRGDSLILSSIDYMDINSFSKKFNFEYSLDTIDDIISLNSSGKDIKLLLNSYIGILNGSIISFKNPPIYFNGKIFVPSELEQIVDLKKTVSFKPLFNIKTIVIDPGHGGKDPGAISPNGLQEKIVNLSISKYLKEELEKRGFNVQLTRSTDKFISLKQRVDFAKNCDADFFISIHANANPSRNIKGVEFYYLSPSRLDSDARSIRIAKSEMFNGKNMPVDAKAILWDMLITKNYAFSVEFSNILYYNFKRLGFNSRAPKKAPFYVLRLAYVPAVLVETGYLTNRYEEKALRRASYQKQIAETIAMAVTSLKKRYTQFSSCKLAEVN